MGKILIVDDDAHLAAMVAMVLGIDGHDCLNADSATTARRLLETAPAVDLLLLDQNLGENSPCGLTLLYQLRHDPKFRQLPVIVCTGDSRAMLVLACLGQRIDGYIKKPFSLSRVREDVNRVVAEHGSPRASSGELVAA